MSRLIDADALIRDIEHYHVSDGKFQHWVEVQPTIEERKTGKWIEYDNSHCECPFCHEEWGYFDNEVEHFDFCPRCGADMRGEQHEILSI